MLSNWLRLNTTSQTANECKRPFLLFLQLEWRSAMVCAQRKRLWEQSNPSISLCSIREKNYMRRYKGKGVISVGQVSAFSSWVWRWKWVINVLWLQWGHNSRLFLLVKHCCWFTRRSFTLEPWKLSVLKVPFIHTYTSTEMSWLPWGKKKKKEKSIWSGKQDWAQLSFHFNFQQTIFLILTTLFKYNRCV